MMTKEETDKVCSLLFRATNGHPAMSPKFVGQPASYSGAGTDIHMLTHADAPHMPCHTHTHTHTHMPHIIAAAR